MYQDAVISILFIMNKLKEWSSFISLAQFMQMNLYKMLNYFAYKTTQEGGENHQSYPMEMGYGMSEPLTRGNSNFIQEKEKR